MPAYTPGPWSTFKTLPGVYAENGREIVYHSHMTRSAEPHERMANARLIASAPELLEALKGTLALLEAREDEGPFLSIHPISKARLAIAKAEGR